MSLSPITPQLASQPKQDSPDDKEARETRLRYWTNTSLVFAVLVGLTIAAVHGGSRTTSIAAFGAALGLGGVLGFLFGIPGNSRQPASRAQAAIVVKPPVDPMQANPPQPGETVEAVSEPGVDTKNTVSTDRTSNLEQVADWVTKLLLGGGLTQMQRIPPKIWQWSRMVSLGILRDSNDATERVIVANQAFAAGLLVYGFILGFFAGFLITKLQLGNAISD